MELLLIVLVIILLFGGYRTYHSGAFAFDVVGIILVVLLVVILLSFLTPYGHRAYLF